MDLLAVTWAQGIITFLFVLICILLMIVILLQKGRGGGLSGAFGGAGGHSAFGAKTGDVFTWVTVALTGLFILLAVIGNYKFVPPPPEVPAARQAQPTGAGTDKEPSPPPAGSSTGRSTSQPAGGAG